MSTSGTEAHPYSATADDVLKNKQLNQQHVRSILGGIALFVIGMSVVIGCFALADHVHSLNSHKVEVGLTNCIDAGHAGYDADRTSCIG